MESKKKDKFLVDLASERKRHRVLWGRHSFSAPPHAVTMSSYDEGDLEDMEWNAELGAFTFQCPCGDVFQITPAELRAGEEIAHCPSCSLVVTVVYEDEDLKNLIPEGF